MGCAKSVLALVQCMRPQERTYQGYQPTKRHKNDDDSDSPVFDDNELKLLEQEREFTSTYLFESFKELEEAIRNNNELRLKYSQEPEKFYQSEYALNAILSKLSSISAYPNLTVDFIKSNILRLVMDLLDHPNESIVGEAVEVIYEFLMMEIEDEAAAEQHLKYWRQVSNEEFLGKLLGLLKRLNEEVVAEYESLFKVLRVVEELLTLFPNLSNLVVDCSEIMRYLSNRILPNFVVEFKTIDDTKFVATEVLVELLQFSKENRFTFHKFDGMEVLLECIKPFRETKQDFKKTELEFLSNIFNLVSIMNIEPEVQQVFNQQKAVELMLHFIKQKNYFSKHALKCLSSGVDQSSVRDLIDLGGLKYLFPILMHQGLKAKDPQDQMIIDESSTQIILMLLSSTNGIDLERVIYKFKEKNFEKLLRVVEMRVEYSDLVQEGEKELEEKEYLEALGKGFKNIELIDLLLLHLCVKNPQLKSNIKEICLHFSFNTQRIQRSLEQQLRHLNENSAEHAFISHQLGNMFPFLLTAE